MIEIHNNFLSDIESNQLIDYFNSNLESTIAVQNDVYSFKYINISNYLDLLIAKKLNLTQIETVRVQLVDDSVKTNEYMHIHSIPLTYLIFLNDNFEGGNLNIENISVKPKKNQLLIFEGRLRHNVDKVTKGNRYTFVAHVHSKAKITNNIV